MTRSFALCAALLIMLAGSAPPAHADVRSHTVKQSIDTLHVAMKAGRQLVLSFKAHVIELDSSEGDKITAKLRRRTNTVVLWAPEDTPAERLSGRFAIATARYVLLVDVSPAGDEADDAIEINDAGLVELCSARDQREIEAVVSDALAKQAAEFTRKLADQEEHYARELQRKDAQNAEKTDQAMLDQVTDKLQEVPLEPIPCAGDGLVVCEPKLMLIGDGAVLRLISRNSSPYQAPIADVRVYNAKGENLVTGVNIGRDGDDPDDPDWSRAPDDPTGVVGVIPPGGTAITSVKLRNPERLGSPFRVVMAGVASILPATQPVHLMDRMQQEALERRERYLRDREAKRVSLHLVGSYGAIWLPSGADGPEDLEPASLKGLGLRVTKGITSMVAFEAEIGGATSGIAEYGTVTLGGTEGELTRSAKLGRVSLGGMLRFGDKLVPYARAGLGVQVVSQDASMMTTGGEMSGPGSGMDVGMGVYVGAGVDVKLGSNLVAGAGVSFTASQHNQQILDVGLNVAYRWDAAQ